MTVTGVIPTGNVDPEAGTGTIVTVVQLSDAVGRKFTTAPHSPSSVAVVMLAGHKTLGASSSTTVTVNEHVVTLPAASVAVAVTVVVPMLKTVPELISVTTDTVLQLSVALVSKSTTALQMPDSVDVVISAGQDTAGGSVSSTVTVNVHEV